MIVPAYSEKWPQPVSIVYVEDADSGKASLRVHAHRGHVPDPMRRLASSDSDRTDRMHLDIDSIGLAAPSLEIRSNQVVGSDRCLKIRLKPAANQHRVVLAMNPSVDSVAVDGKPILSSLRSVAFNFAERRVAEIELTIPDQIELTVQGHIYDLPSNAESLRDTRPAWAVPLRFGDHTIVLKRFEF